MRSCVGFLKKTNCVIRTASKITGPHGVRGQQLELYGRLSRSGVVCPFPQTCLSFVQLRKLPGFMVYVGSSENRVEDLDRVLCVCSFKCVSSVYTASKTTRAPSRRGQIPKASNTWLRPPHHPHPPRSTCFKIRGSKQIHYRSSSHKRQRYQKPGLKIRGK